jgi:ethanolamine ammonia-lyase small subunit
MSREGDFDAGQPAAGRAHLPNVAAVFLQNLRDRTPARLAVGRAGHSYRTMTQLDLWEDHAAAVDAVHRELEFARDFDPEFIAHAKLFEVSTIARDKKQFLQYPRRGRSLSAAARERVARDCPARADFQVAIGDGLSAAAVAVQIPTLVPLLEAGARRRGWTYGRPFVIRYCRVGVLNDIGALLEPEVVVLLIGERPGLATAESLSAYMAFRPRPGHTDALRNLISNIHARGVDCHSAAERILALAALMRDGQRSGLAIKEQLPFMLLPPPSGEKRSGLPGR